MLQTVYQWLEMSRANRLLQLRFVQSYRARTRGVRDMSAGDVADLVEAVQVVIGRAYLVGGWGVDALVGRQTRLHDDLDLAYEAQPGAEERILAVLEPWGYRIGERHFVAAGLFPVRTSLRDASGRGIDLLPFRPFDSPDAPMSGTPHPEALPSFQPDDFVSGTLRTRGKDVQVHCLRSGLQLASRERYALRRSDHHDIAQLQRHEGHRSGAH